MKFTDRRPAVSRPDLKLPVLFLSRYLFFLANRPISRSNTHFVQTRIHGLQSLGQLLDAPEASASATLLRALNPSNLHEMAERLQLALWPLSQTEIPRNYFAADHAPPAEFLGSAQRILLLLGPAIGIGDEIVTFPLPAWIKQANPDADITVLTAYDNLWARVAAVGRAVTYTDYETVVAAIGGRSDLGPFDLVVFIDFENPELYQAVTYAKSPPKYAELSLGGRVLLAVDNAARHIYRMGVPTFLMRNVYDGFDWLARGIGARTAGVDRFRDILSRQSPDPGGPLVVFVSPFTSKYDPSARYWSQLICGLVPPDGERSFRFVIDTGPNLATRRFSSDVANVAAAHLAPSVATFEVAPADAGSGLSLEGVFAQLEQAHVVVCADSFTAHAAALTDATSLVLATPGLEYWRVPHSASFRFDADTPLDDLIAAMRLAVAHGGAASPRDHGAPVVCDDERELASRDLELACGLAEGASFEELSATFERFLASRRAVYERLATWPAGARALVGDGLDAITSDGLSGSPLAENLHAVAIEHVTDQWRQWRQSNLFKYLGVLQADGQR